MTTLRATLLGVAMCLLPATPALSTDKNGAPSAGCLEDTTVRVCVSSAAVGTRRRCTNCATSFPADTLTVNVSLRLTNLSDFPIEIAMVDDGRQGVAFVPDNAPALLPRRSSVQYSGLRECRSVSRCSMTTIAPGQSALAQISYYSLTNEGGLRLIHVATTASFSARIFIVERGEPRVSSLSLEGFRFGNALPRN